MIPLADHSTGEEYQHMAVPTLKDLIARIQALEKAAVRLLAQGKPEAKGRATAPAKSKAEAPGKSKAAASTKSPSKAKSKAKGKAKAPTKA
jgi:hypothetical protein